MLELTIGGSENEDRLNAFVSAEMRQVRKRKSIKRASKRKQFEKKICEYRKFLREDEDYDWHFIIRLLRFKIQRTRSHIIEHNVISDSKVIGRQMQTVIDLLLRLEKDEYLEETHRDFWRKYGKPRLIRGKPNKDGSVPVTVRHAKETPRNKKTIIREVRRLSKKTDALRKRDLKKALDLINKNIWGWWD